MESQPQNPEFRNITENFSPWLRLKVPVNNMSGPSQRKKDLKAQLKFASSEANFILPTTKYGRERTTLPPTLN